MLFMQTPFGLIAIEPLIGGLIRNSSLFFLLSCHTIEPLIGGLILISPYCLYGFTVVY